MVYSLKLNKGEEYGIARGKMHKYQTCVILSSQLSGSLLSLKIQVPLNLKEIRVSNEEMSFMPLWPCSLN